MVGASHASTLLLTSQRMEYSTVGARRAPLHRRINWNGQWLVREAWGVAVAGMVMGCCEGLASRSSSLVRIVATTGAFKGGASASVVWSTSNQQTVVLEKENRMATTKTNRTTKSSKKTTTQLIAELRDLSAQEGPLLFYRLSLANRIMDDYEWIGSAFSGNAAKAMRHLEETCFAMLSGAFTLGEMLEAYQWFNDEAVWKNYHYNLRAMLLLLRDAKAKENDERSPLDDHQSRRHSTDDDIDDFMDVADDAAEDTPAEGTTRKSFRWRDKCVALSEVNRRLSLRVSQLELDNQRLAEINEQLKVENDRLYSRVSILENRWSDEGRREPARKEKQASC